MNSPPPLLAGRRIAFFHQSADLYGSDRMLLHLAEGTRHAGADTVVLLPEHGLLTEALAGHGIEHHVLPLIKLSRARMSPGGLLQLAREACLLTPACDRIFDGRHIDLIHSNTLAVLGGAWHAWRRQVPHLWHVHEMIEHPRLVARAFPPLVQWCANRVVCNSHATRNWLIARQPRLAARTSVIWNGLKTPPPTAADVTDTLRQRFHPGGARLAVGLIGRINRTKGHALLLDALEQLHAQGIDNFSLVFVGSAPPGQTHFEDELRQRIAASPLRDRIHLKGFMTDIWPAHDALDVVCVPSTGAEAFGLVAIEAMAMGKPVIAARQGGLEEIVVDGTTGFTFTPNQADDLALVLRRLLCDDAQRITMGRAGKARFDMEFSLDRMIGRFIATYAQMMEQQP